MNLTSPARSVFRKYRLVLSLLVVSAHPVFTHASPPRDTPASPSIQAKPASLVTLGGRSYNDHIPLTATLDITPEGGVSAEGPAGGPLTRSVNELTLINLTAQPLNWTSMVEPTLVPDPAKPGSTISQTLVQLFAMGVIPGNGSVPLTWTLTDAAASLPPGIYASKIDFFDVFTGNKAVVPVSIVARGPSWFQFGAISSPQVAGMPFAVTLEARDKENLAIPNYTGTVGLYLRHPVDPAETRPVDASTPDIRDMLINGYPTERSQMLYLQTELGGAGKITALALNFTEPPGVTLPNLTIRLMATARVNQIGQPNFDSGPWTVVYQGNPSLTQTGWVNFPFTQGYAYDGLSSLVVDISYQKLDKSNTLGVVQGCLTDDIRKMSYVTTDLTQDPLTWDGALAPYREYALPAMRLTVNPYEYIAVDPTAATFKGGQWQGTVTVHGPLDEVQLVAFDYDSVYGYSAPLSVLQDLTKIWVDFLWTGESFGTATRPYYLLLDGLAAVNPGGTVKIKTGQTPEKYRITKKVRLEAVGGPVRLGVH